MRSDYIPVTYGRLSSNNDWFLRKLLFFFISNKKVFFFFLVSSSSFWQKSSFAPSLLLCEVSSVSVKYLFSFKLVYLCVCVSIASSYSLVHIYCQRLDSTQSVSIPLFILTILDAFFRTNIIMIFISSFKQSSSKKVAPQKYETFIEFKKKYS